MSDTPERVKEFWDSRAREFGADSSATLTDQYLRELEIRTIIRYLRKLRPKTVIDVGCGNGFSTLRFAESFPDIQFQGVDYSEEMVQYAKANERQNCHFQWSDLTRPETLPAGSFDVILTQRCIQNVLDAGQQMEAIASLHSRLTPRGVLLLMECSNDGLRQFNRLSLAVRKGRAAKEPPFHNLWFNDEELKTRFGARVDCFCSTYMVAKALSARLRPIGFHLPQVGSFGYDRLYVIAARP